MNNSKWLEAEESHIRAAFELLLCFCGISSQSHFGVTSSSSEIIGGCLFTYGHHFYLQLRSFAYSLLRGLLDALSRYKQERSNCM